MTKKKVLFLGAAYSQIPIIKEARERGWYIITCDYLPNNPGHKFADEYHNVSTTDNQGVLNLAAKVKPDYVIAYASDPASPTAAYVSEKLGLPGNSYQSVRILSEKDMFRECMQKHGFNTPKNVSIKKNDNYLERLKEINMPFMIKPTDSSGSKGITKIENEAQIDQAVDFALKNSRNGRLIAEEYVDNIKGDLHGDGFVYNGKVVFSLLGDHIYNNATNPFNPIGTLWPTRQPSIIVEKVNRSVQYIVEKCGFTTGAINIEARINAAGEVLIMEIGPRSGGHFVPQAIKYATGVDMVKALLDSMAGEPLELNCPKQTFSAYYALHSDTPGTLKRIEIGDRIKPFIKEYHQYLKPGDEVKPFHVANAALGILLLSFTYYDEMDYYINNMDKYLFIESLKNIY